MSDIMSIIEREIPTMEGWCEVEKAKYLAAMVLTIRPKFCVEIGVFAGRSILPVALALKQNGFGKIVAIDAWSADASIENETDENKKWWSESFNYEEIFQKFLKSLKDNSVEEFVDIKKMRSDQYEIENKIDYLHVDGNHSNQAIKDVEKFAPWVNSGGIVVMDDTTWIGGKVAVAVEKLKSLWFDELFNLGTGAVFKKK